MRQYALVPVFFIMVGCALLGSGWYMSKVPARIVQYEQYGSLTQLNFWVGEPTFVIGNYGGRVNLDLEKGVTFIGDYKGGHFVTHEIRDVVLFTVPRPENMRFYDIENIVITLSNVIGRVYDVSEWHDFVMNVGKLKYPENYLTMGDDPIKIDRLKDFDMDLIGQYDTAEHFINTFNIIGESGVSANMSDASYKIKYNGESVIGIGFVLITSDLGYRLNGEVSIQIEGRGLVKMYGYVTDENGVPLSGVCVSCDYGIVYTDENGYYEINVPEGTVLLTYSENGYYDLRKTLNVPDVENLRVNATLEKMPENVPLSPTPSPPTPPPSLTLDKVLFYSGLAFIVIGVLSLVGMSIASRREKGMYWR
jgi:hypothetical protein